MWRDPDRRARAPSPFGPSPSGPRFRGSPPRAGRSSPSEGAAATTAGAPTTRPRPAAFARASETARSADLNDLPSRRWEITQAPIRRDVGMWQLIEQSAGAGARALSVDPAASRLFDAEQYVLRHGQMRAERQLLMDERDPVAARVER